MMPTHRVASAKVTCHGQNRANSELQIRIDQVCQLGSGSGRMTDRRLKARMMESGIGHFLLISQMISVDCQVGLQRAE